MNASRGRCPLFWPLAALLVLSLAQGVGPAQAAPGGQQAPILPRPTQAVAPSPLPFTASAIAPPSLLAHAAVLIDAGSGAVLFEKNSHQQLPPASLTKMVTALVAVERGELDEMVVATEHSMTEPSVIGMEIGDRLPLREALYGMLLNSGNDVALAIAESIGRGSIARYVGWMNGMVRSLGLVDSRFANPNGLDVSEHYSSAYDMAIIGRVLMRQPLLRTIVATPRHDFDGPPLWAFRNINTFLGRYPGAEGIKTGYETRAGRCLAASATRGGRELIAVVLNTTDYVGDSSTLLDYGFAQLARVPAPTETGPARARQLERRLEMASGRPGLAPAERAFLSSAARGEPAGLDRDPALLLLTGGSVFARLGGGIR